MHASKRAEKIHGRGPDGKEIVFGMVERGGKIIAGQVDTSKKKDLQPLIREYVEAGSAIFTDALKSYDGLSSDFEHAVIDHAVEYANGNVHTNTMENFWSLLKRGLHGSYISVEPFHLFRYIDEQAFRYNNRHVTDADRFVSVMKQIVGRRVTYKELTGKTGNDGRSNLLPGSAKDVGSESASDGESMKAAPFDSTPEFEHFKTVMRAVVAVPKKRLDALVQKAKEESPRNGDPHAPGQKRRRRTRFNTIVG